jgi:hypothetical protein
MQQASPLFIKKSRLLKSPLGKIWMDVTYDGISYVRGLYG